MRKNGFLEFLIPEYELKNTGIMTEGTAPVPPYRSCANSDDEVLPIQRVSHAGELQRRGETPVERLACC
jgi:hypothetical protein